ncbi:MAG: hypothetical protein ACI4NM_10815 [Bullifex sp.]
MIISVEDFRLLVETDIPDDELRTRLSALEMAIRKYTNNHFFVKGAETKAEVRGGKIYIPSPFFKTGDTIELLSPEYEGRVFTVSFLNGDEIEVDGTLRFDCITEAVLVEYPEDVIMGAVNLLKWDISNREKVGIKSETLSRWSVTYFDLDANSLLGYPSSLLGFAHSYRKARF